MAAEEKKMQQMRELFLANPALLSRVCERAEILITTTRFYILTMEPNRSVARRLHPWISFTPVAQSPPVPCLRSYRSNREIR